MRKLFASTAWIEVSGWMISFLGVESLVLYFYRQYYYYSGIPNIGELLGSADLTLLGLATGGIGGYLKRLEQIIGEK